MRRNPYKIRDTFRFGLSPRIRNRFNRLPTLRGHEGRWWRRGLIAIGVILLALLAYRFLKPERSLMASVEVRRIENRGMLIVGVRNDMPGFCEDEKGLEAELALLLAKKILPDSDDPLKLVECSSKTVSTKLKDGTIDVAIALQPKSNSYSCSYSYYTDTVSLVTLKSDNVPKKISDMRVGYIPDTSAGSLFESYIKSVTTVNERTIVDKLFGRPAATPDPATSVTIDSVKLGSYDELILALKEGRIDSAVMAGAYIHKYFEALADETDVDAYYLCNDTVGTLDYCVVSSSDEPALAGIADMLIYRLKEDGELVWLIADNGL